MPIKLSEIAGHRLMNQQVIAPQFSTPGKLLHWMGAMQAQDYEMAKWAVGLRFPGATLASVEKAIEDGTIIRTHVLRPTWHFVAAGDLNWLLGITGPRVRIAMRSRHKQLGLTDDVVSKSNEVIKKALSEATFLSRSKLVQILEQAGFKNKDNLASHLLLRAELDKVICSGPSKGKDYTYALFEERVPETSTLGKEEALAKLADVYFRSHGPATLEDFVWWSGLTKTQASKALDLSGGNLISDEIDGREYWLKESLKPQKTVNSVHLLPAYDEYLISYKSRDPIISPNAEKKAISNNGIFRPIVIVNGKVTGIWKRSVKKEKVEIEIKLFEKLTKKITGEVEREAIKFADFLGKRLEIKFQS